MGGTPFRRYARIAQNSYRARTRKQFIRRTCSNEKAATRPAEGGTEIFANQRYVLDLTFSGITNCLFKKPFTVKKNDDKSACFGAVSGVGKQAVLILLQFKP